MDVFLALSLCDLSTVPGTQVGALIRRESCSIFF